jgi:hypothetical protein
MIPVEIPNRFLTAVAVRAVRRIGTTLRDRATGRILAHLQETGYLQSLVGTGQSVASTGGNPVGLLLSAGQLASSIAANVQLEQVKAMLSTLQLLSGVSLAASVVGIGVSVAGFALVLRRLDNVERSIAGVRGEAVAARLAAERVDIQLATANRAVIEYLLYRAEEAWVRSDAVEVWKQVEGPMDQAQRYWRGLVGGRAGPSIFRDPHFTLGEAAAAYEAAPHLASARLQTLLLIEQHAGALHYAQEFHDWHERVVGALVATDLADARSGVVAERERISEEDARARLLRLSRDFLDGVREVQLQVSGRPAVVQVLIDRGIGGREYIEAVRARADVPLLVLPVRG